MHRVGNLSILKPILELLAHGIAEGLRLGWVAAEHSLLTQFVKIKQSADLHTSNFDQGVADAYMETYDL